MILLLYNDYKEWNRLKNIYKEFLIKSEVQNELKS